MTNILVKSGTFNSNPIENQHFKMVRSPRVGTRGLYVTVDANPINGLPDRNIRVLLKSNKDVVYVDGQPATDFVSADTPVEKPVETDEEIMTRMRQKFEVLDDMAHASCNGIVRGMIVTGPPGIGKSYGVERIVAEAEVMGNLTGKGAKCGIEKGSASPIGLYMLLHAYSVPGSVLVLDDSDTMLYDETSLNLLKAALDSGRRRTLSWYSESNALKEKKIPNTFEFQGSVIFITNLDFANHRGRIAPHLSALVSRCHYLDMGIHGTREKFLRCKQIVHDGMLRRYNFSTETEADIVDFIDDNKYRLREISLRMVTKIADLRKMNPEKWKMYAKNTCLV